MIEREAWYREADFGVEDGWNYTDIRYKYTDDAGDPLTNIDGEVHVEVDLEINGFISADRFVLDLDVEEIDPDDYHFKDLIDHRAYIRDGQITTRIHPLAFNDQMYPRLHRYERERYTNAQWKDILKRSWEHPCLVTLFFSQKNNHPIFENLTAEDRDRLLEWAKQV